MQVVVQMQVTMEGKGEEERQEEDEEGSSYMFQNWRSCCVVFIRHVMTHVAFFYYGVFYNCC
jgi:hypothetical protein